MRSLRVFCDNHEDLPAVATYYVAELRLVGERATGGLGFMPNDGEYVDLCGECAEALGWEPPVPPGEDEPLSDAQRRLIFARCGELGLDDDARHAILESVTGDPSIKNLLSKDVDRVLRALAEAEASRG